MGIRRMLNYEEYDEVIEKLDDIIKECKDTQKYSLNKDNGKLLRIKYITEDIKELIR